MDSITKDTVYDELNARINADFEDVSGAEIHNVEGSSTYCLLVCHKNGSFTVAKYKLAKGKLESQGTGVWYEPGTLIDTIRSSITGS